MPTLPIWTKCNNNCLMCTNPDRFKNENPGKYYSLSKIIGQLDSWKKQGIVDDHFILTGGEPTLHPHFFKILRLIRLKFPKYRLDICTNGRHFAYFPFCEECLKIKNLNLIIPILGNDGRVHDSITRSKGSFSQTIRGIRNILALRGETQTLEIRIILIKSVIRSLEKILKFLKREFPLINQITLIFPEFEGQAAKNNRLVGVNYSKVRQALEKNFSLIKTFADLRLYHFPLCVLPSKFWPYTWRTLPPEEVIYLPICRKCRYQNYCMGVHKLYPGYMGAGEFRPPKEKKLAIEAGESFYHPIKKI